MEPKTPRKRKDEEEMHLYSKEEYRESRQTGNLMKMLRMIPKSPENQQVI